MVNHQNLAGILRTEIHDAKDAIQTKRFDNLWVLTSDRGYGGLLIINGDIVLTEATVGSLENLVLNLKKEA